MRRCSPSLWTMCYLRNLSTINAIKLTSNHLWIFKLCVVRQIFPHTSNYFWIFKLCVVHQTFPHSLQLTYHRIICEFSNCAFFANISTIIALDLSSNHSCILKLCVVRQMFPHSMQITRHPIIYVFSNEALFAKPFQTHHEAGQRPILSKESKN